MAKYDVIKNRLNVFASVNNILNEKFVETVDIVQEEGILK
jgi:vitamin B12 transporter